MSFHLLAIRIFFRWYFPQYKEILHNASLWIRPLFLFQKKKIQIISNENCSHTYTPWGDRIEPLKSLEDANDLLLWLILGDIVTTKSNTVKMIAGHHYHNENDKILNASSISTGPKSLQ